MEESKFRQEIYDYLCSTVPQVMRDMDMDIFIRLMCYVFGDLYERGIKLPDEVDPDRCSASNLKHLAALIGYKWDNNLTVDNQREYIKMYLLIRKYRGSRVGLMNLIRVFGQSVESFYSSSDLRGVEIKEYDPYDNRYNETEEYFPGDIIIRIPELSNILRDAIEDVRPVGRRIIFVYVIFLGIYHLYMEVEQYSKIHKYPTIFHSNRDCTFVELFPDVKFTDSDYKGMPFYTHQLQHCTGYYDIAPSVQTVVRKVKPFEEGFLFNHGKEPDDYRGYLYDEPILLADDILYD